MTKKQLMEILDRIDDDFEINIKLEREIPEEELANMLYPYPIETTDLIYNSYDIGYSGKKILIYFFEK